MKHIILALFTLHFSLFTSFASPFAPDPGVDLVIYSSEASSSPVHVETIETNIFARPKHWTFPASYTGHRSVCRLPGATTNDSFRAWSGGERFSPGDPFGVSSLRDYPTIELTKVSPIFDRINIMTGESARDKVLGDLIGDTRDPYPDWTNAAPYAAFEHIRIIPKSIMGSKHHGEWFELCTLITNRVVAEFDVNSDTKQFLSEGDFIRDGQFDIHWDGFDSNDFMGHSKVAEAVGDVTAVKYRIVFGKEGPVGRESDLDTTTVVRAFSTLIERRYENNRTLPSGLRTDGIVYGARPTFRWRLDEPTSVDGYASSAALYGCTYTAFQIQIKNMSDQIVFDTGVIRAPARDKNGFFKWESNYQIDQQSGLKWRVAMYNAKFKPLPAVLEARNGWSAYAEFSTSVDTQQE